MRRSENDLYVKQIKPLFWKKCNICGDEFKKEIGYEIKKIVYDRFLLNYVCGECANNKDEALIVFNKNMDFDEYNPPSASSSVRVHDTQIDKLKDMLKNTEN